MYSIHSSHEGKLMTLRSLVVGLVVWLLCAPAAWAYGPPDFSQRPDGEECIVDEADLITPVDERTVRRICEELRKQKAIVIMVVTIHSMDEHGAQGWFIESFARMLFDQWGIGHERVNGRDWNKGILLLVSRVDRQARIELGAGYGRLYDDDAEVIMNGHIVPRFKRGEFSEGILAGVRALDKLARDQELPPRYVPSWLYGVCIGFVVLMLLTVISLIRRGRRGWAWLGWGALFTVFGYLLLTSGRSAGSFPGGSFSGGSFGGGFSGGGGATGSW